MTETKTYCDHCGKQLDTMVDAVGITLETSYHFCKADLCNECLVKLNKLVDTFLSCKHGQSEE